MEDAVDEHRVLVVDDDRGLVRLIEKALAREGVAATTACSGAEAIAAIEATPPSLLLLDLKLQDMEASELVTRLTVANRCPPFIIITGQGDERVAVEMMKRGARDYLVKDASFLQFVPSVVKRSLEQLDKERRLAEAEEQVHLVRSVIEQGFNAVLITGADLPDPRVLYINPAFAGATGYRPDQIVGQPLSAIAGLTNLKQRLRSGLPEGAGFLDEISTYQTAQGERIGEWRVGPVEDKNGKITHWLIIFRDITERKRLEKEILEISDQERRRIGQDLHDGLCQHLAGIELMSQVLEQKLATKSKTDAARIGEISKHVRDAIGQTRSLARGLSPVTLESEGLASALQELAATTEKMFGITCRVAAAESGDVHAAAVETHLYRIAQEAVSNAFKHGKAREIVIQLEALPEAMVLSVTDDGSGIPEPPPRNRGMGLRIMDYRASMIGGALSIRRNPNGGTTVRCSVPTPAKATSTQSRRQ
jgi:two-component system sensor kinase FixL